MIDLIWCVLYSITGLIGMTLMKASNAKTSVGLETLFSLKYILGAFFYAASFLIYSLVVLRMNISIILPIIASINSVLTVLIGTFIFKEEINYGQIIGIALVILGIFVIAYFSTAKNNAII